MRYNKKNTIEGGSKQKTDEKHHYRTERKGTYIRKIKKEKLH